MSERMLETVVQVGSGFIIAWLVNHYALPLWGFNATVQNTTTVTLIFTGLALIRVYLVRMYFDWRKKNV